MNTKPMKRVTLALRTGALLAGLCVTSTAWSAEDLMQLAYRDTLKGGSKLSTPRPIPEKHLGLLPPEERRDDEQLELPDDQRTADGGGKGTPGQDRPGQETPGQGAGPGPGARGCSPELDAAPMVVGSRDQYAKIGGLVKNVGMGLLSKALSSATGGALQGGGGGKRNEEPQPALHEDPIKKKFRSKVKDKASGAKLSLGGQLANDGLLLSTRLDDADDNGTLHEVYLERDDCRRIYPFAEYAYELWGKWNLSVSWTKTTSSYQDGKLVDQQKSSGGFEKSGKMLLASGGGILPLSEALAKVPPELRGEMAKYHSQLRDEMQQPLWQRAGFGAPTSGGRSFGTMYRLSEADRAALESGRMRAVVQVTRESGPVYEAVGIPVSIGAGEEGHLAFASLLGKN